MGQRQLAAQAAARTNGIQQPFQLSGAPVNGTSFAGKAVVGSQAVDTTNGKLYVCTSLSGGPQWTVVGTQT